MNNKNIYIKTTLLLIICFVLLLNLKLIINNLSIYFINFWMKTFPSLFISIIITSILIKSNTIYYISKIIKNYPLKILIISLLIGFPSNILIIKNDIKNNIINENDMKYILPFSIVFSPIYLISNTFLLFSNKAYIILLIYYLFHIFIFLIFRKKVKYNSSVNKKLNLKLSDITIETCKESFNIIINTCSIVMFFSLFLCIIKDNNTISITLKGLIEFSSGINELNLINISLYKKGIIYLMILLFNSLSIITQLNYYLKENNINYKLYIYTKILILIQLILLI